MIFLGIFFVIFGGLIIVYPQFLAYMIGFFFVALGVNVWVMRFIFARRMHPPKKGGIQAGEYEIFWRK